MSIPENQSLSQSKIVNSEVKSEDTNSKINLKKPEIKSNLDEIIEIRKNIAKDKITEAKNEAARKLGELKGQQARQNKLEEAKQIKSNIKDLSISETSASSNNKKLIIVTSIGSVIFILLLIFLYKFKINSNKL